MTQLAPINPIDDRLRHTLAKYVEFNRATEDDQLIYKAKREIAIARSALERANSAYNLLIETLTNSLTKLGVSDDSAIAQLVATISQIEEKSANLISMTEKVSKILKTAADIEGILSTRMDGVQMYSAICQIPLFLKQVVINVTNDEDLADRLSASLQDKIRNEMTVLEPDNLVPVQISEMLHSVPTNEAAISPTDTVSG